MTPGPETKIPSLAPANRNDSTTSRRKRVWLVGCAGVAFLIILMACLFVWRSFAHDIESLPKGEQYKTTRFEFRYGKATRVVDDPENHMQRVYGGMPDSITVTDGIRLIVYNEPKAVIKSRSDSMDVMNDSLKHGGYMGMSSTGTNFVVDHNGVIQAR
jgi:hypothetical protein